MSVGSPVASYEPSCPHFGEKWDPEGSGFHRCYDCLEGEGWEYDADLEAGEYRSIWTKPFPLENPPAREEREEPASPASNPGEPTDSNQSATAGAANAVGADLHASSRLARHPGGVQDAVEDFCRRNLEHGAQARKYGRRR